MSSRLPRLVVPLLVVALAALGLRAAGRGGAAPAPTGQGGADAEVVWSGTGAALHAVREGSADRLRSPARTLAVVAVVAALLAGLQSRPARLAPVPASGGASPGVGPLRRRGPPRRAR